MAQNDLSEKIRAAAQAKDVDPELALKIAQVESGLNPQAGAKTSSAKGLFQVIDKTWSGFGGKPGQQKNPEENIRVGTDVIASNVNFLRKTLGREPSHSEVYAAHFFGPTGAKEFLSADPKTLAEEVFGKSVLKANPQLQGKTVGEIRQMLAGKMGEKPQARPTQQAKTKDESVEPMMQKALESGISAKAPAAPADLGAGYKAALALSFLGNDDGDLPTTDEELRERLDKSFEERMAETEAQKPRFNAVADLDLQALSAAPAIKPIQMNDGGEVEGLIPDEPPVKVLRNANKMTSGDRQIENLMVGLGIDQAMLGVSLDKMKMGEKENLARNLMAMYEAKFGDMGVNAAVIRPLDAPSGLYVGSLGASYPVGQGQIRAGVNAMRTPDGETRTTGHSLGYSGKVGPGYLDAQMMVPKGSPQGRSAQLQYRMQFGDGGEVGEEEPKLTGINKAVDFIAQRLPADKFPTAARMLLETVQGNKGPITEKHFGEEELNIMRQLALQKGGDRGNISYSDYIKLAEQMNKKGQVPASYTPSLLSMFDPMGNVQTTLGRFSYQRDPQGNLQIIDKYDFNPLNPNAMQEARTGDYGAFGPYGVIRDYAGEKIPPGKGREVRINLGPVKRAEGSPETGEVGPYIGNPNIKRQGEAARRLAAMRDVNTLPDPKTYAAVAGFMGVPPDEMGFSVMHPQYKQIQQVAEPAFMAGTAAQIAPVLGPVIRGAGKMVGSALNERMLAGQSLTPGLNTPAPVNFAVRPRGGPYLLQETGRGYKDPVQMALEDTQSMRDPTLSKWFSDKFGAYMRRDMGSPQDQMVQAAEEGRKLHFAKLDKDITKADVMGDIPFHTKGTRKLEGFDPEGEARTAYGKFVEGKIDLPIEPVVAEGLSFSGREAAIPPSMRQAAIKDPSMRFYDLDPWIGRELKLEEMHDFMANMRESGGVLKKYGQTASIPKEYQFTDQSLQGLTPAQASERVALAEKWMQDTSQKLASEAVSKNSGLISHTYPNGSKWASFPDLAEDPNLLRLVQDVGCDGGWCTRGEATALAYGSEEGKRLHILLDKKSRPKAQITLQESLGTPSDFMNDLGGKDYDAFMQKYPSVAAVFESDAATLPWRLEAILEDVGQTPEFRQWASRQGARITEIKGVNNTNDLTKAPFLPEIQDFVKRMDRERNLQAVKNLDGIGMVDMSVYAPNSADKGVRLHDVVRRLNDGSMYAPAAEKDKLLEDALQTFVKEIEGKASGGLIERQNTDNRRYM